jgi:hypothetical protein
MRLLKQTLSTISVSFRLVIQLKRSYFHLLLGVEVGYEQMNADSSGDLALGAIRPSRFTYDPQAGLEADFFLGNRVSLVATASKSYMFNHPLIDEWPGLGSVGLRYHFR